MGRRQQRGSDEGAEDDIASLLQELPGRNVARVREQRQAKSKQNGNREKENERRGRHRHYSAGLASGVAPAAALLAAASAAAFFSTIRTDQIEPS